MMINFKPAIIAFVALPLISCTFTLSDIVDFSDDDVATTPAVKVKPELDYSDETPDCVIAGERMAENVQVGMSLSEVVRLVGKPSFKLPGSWWWSSSFSQEGVPVVKFKIGSAVGTKPITSFLANTENC